MQLSDDNADVLINMPQLVLTSYATPAYTPRNVPVWPPACISAQPSLESSLDYYPIFNKITSI